MTVVAGWVAGTFYAKDAPFQHDLHVPALLILLTLVTYSDFLRFLFKASHVNLINEGVAVNSTANLLEKAGEAVEVLGSKTEGKQLLI